MGIFLDLRGAPALHPAGDVRIPEPPLFLPTATNATNNFFANIQAIDRLNDKYTTKLESDPK